MRWGRENAEAVQRFMSDAHQVEGRFLLAILFRGRCVELV